MHFRRAGRAPRETALLAALCLLLLTLTWAQGRQTRLAEKMIRLHVVAASDGEADQAAKLRVRDAVLAQLAPALEGAADAREACAAVRELLPALEETAAQISGGAVRGELGREYYPTREYDTFSLPAGVYTSLRITLGEGRGRNWWCVVYPALCSAPAEELRETAALSRDELGLITLDGEGCVLRFRILEWWGQLAGRAGCEDG